MGHVGDEAFLTDALARTLGTEVLGAGIFGLQDLAYVQAAGDVAGGLAANLAAPGDALSAGLAAGVGGHLAKEEAARRLGMTLQLVVAVTADDIHIINWETGDHPGGEVLRLPRATTEVKVTGFGLSKIVALKDTASGTGMTLHATAAPFRPQSKPDAHVLGLLTAV